MEIRPPFADPARRDALAADLADRLADVVAPVVDRLLATLGAEVPASIGWTPGQHERARATLEAVVTGFLRYLRIGDLEASDCERLRDAVSEPPPGAGRDAAGELVRTLRAAALDAARDAVGALSDEQRRLLGWELEGYLALLTAPPRRVDDIGDLDPWLARIAASGRDVRPAPRERAP